LFSSIIDFIFLDLFNKEKYIFWKEVIYFGLFHPDEKTGIKFEFEFLILPQKKLNALNELTFNINESF